MNTLVNTNLTCEQLRVANWLIENVGEFRQLETFDEGRLLLAFISPNDLEELGELLQKVNSDFFTDGSLELSYNGSDIVINILPILRFELGGLDPKLIYEDWSADEV